MGVFSVAAGEDPPYTATSLLLAGDYKEAVPATNRVLTTVTREWEEVTHRVADGSLQDATRTHGAWH